MKREITPGYFIKQSLPYWLTTLAWFVFVDRNPALQEVIFPTYVITAITLVSGKLADRITTIRGLNLINQADNLGIDHSYHEAFPYLPDRPTKKDFFDPKILMTEVSGMVCGITCQPLGLIMGGYSFLCAANNRRTCEDLRVTIK